MAELLFESRLYTVEEFEAFADAPENSNRRFELIYGEIVEKVLTEEQAVLVVIVGAYIKQHSQGRVALKPLHRTLHDSYNARLPDVAYTSAERLLPITKKGSVPQMPDLCVEIQSPDDKPHEMREKAMYYLRNGARLVWLVYSKTRTIEVCTVNSDGVLQIQVVDERGEINGGEVLPGFTLSVSAIFETE
jgi:Uma2 family endonuclease